MDAISQKVEEQYVSSSLFTGGFNAVTRAHIMDKVIDSKINHPQMAGAKGSSCSVPDRLLHGCHKGRRWNLLGCKEQYKTTDLDELVVDNGARPLTLPPPVGMSKNERSFWAGVFQHHQINFRIKSLPLARKINPLPHIIPPTQFSTLGFMDQKG
ncbi:hypothetical protein L2E82_35588 [Cichorium intybus]|uniref:Uncharacterized protein n=1 Tax=Cichorium intybus TaxID=13427 RepID=A0ACB9BP72_CICIN|nr:hypothetical protein L2E82_35588 [Cichorium intybus]